MKKLFLPFIVILSFLFVLTSCHSDDNSDSPQEDDPLEDPIEDPVDSTISQSALKLLHNLSQNANQGNILLGHQATTIAGVNWRLWQMPDYSDFKAVSGKFPAYYGWEMSPRPDNQNETYDYVSFDITISEAKKAFNRGGVNSFSMHPYRLDNHAYAWDNSPGLVAKMIPGGSLHDDYKALLDKYYFEFSKLKTNAGEPIPFIYRPYHEANHDWFWWGSSASTDTDYKTLFRFTVQYLRGKGLTNMLVCYAPGYFQNESTFLARYPGDDVVDILGFDGYYGNNNGHGTDWQTLKNYLVLLKNLGQTKNKPIIWAETGEIRLTTSNYFTQLNQAITESGAPIAAVMFWANYQESEYYVPYTNLNNNPLKQDFINFVELPKYQAEGEHTNLYQ